MGKINCQCDCHEIENRHLILCEACPCDAKEIKKEYPPPIQDMEKLLEIPHELIEVDSEVKIFAGIILKINEIIERVNKL